MMNNDCKYVARNVTITLRYFINKYNLLSADIGQNIFRNNFRFFKHKRCCN